MHVKTEGINNIVYIYYISGKMTKLVSLSNPIYQELLRMKKKGMSFSDVISVLLGEHKGKKDIRKFAGAFKNESKLLDKFEKEVERSRKRSMPREIDY